jgi:hypothetical protein
MQAPAMGVQLVGKRIALIAIILLALTSVIIVTVSVRSRSASLLDRATRVAVMDKDELFWWVSDHQVVTTHSSNGTIQALVCHDVLSGKVDPLTRLNALIDMQKGGHRIESMSPDRRALLLWGNGGDQIGATLDGRLLFVDRQTRTPAGTDEPFGCYMANGLSWVQPILAPRKDRFSKYGTAPIARLLIHHGARHTVSKTVAFNPWLEQGGSKTITSRNHFLMYQYSSSGSDFPVSKSKEFLTTVDIDLNASAPESVVTKISLPAGSAPDDVSFSPNGDRVAFLRFHDKIDHGWLPATLQQWWDRLFPRDNPQPYRLSLWVSGIHGEGMHEVGSVPHGTMFGNIDIEEYPHATQWMPDGKTLSFIHRKSVWTVPAD